MDSNFYSGLGGGKLGSGVGVGRGGFGGWGWECTGNIIFLQSRGSGAVGSVLRGRKVSLQTVAGGGLPIQG